MRIIFLAAFIGALAGDALAHDVRLPLGDNKISASPQKRFVFACQRGFPGGGGAHVAGDWISNGYWWPSRKPVVEGDMRWPNAAISIQVEGNKRTVRANNLPKHGTGIFPVRPGSTAYAYDRNPNRIEEQKILLALPLDPVVAKAPACVPMGMIGFAVSGTAIFNALDLQGRDAPAHEIQDRCNGHPERQGQYHYHDWSPCLAARRGDEPVGWMLDGFPILPPTDSKNRNYKTADLDMCHGMVGPVKLNGKTRIMYHYRFTDDYPYTISCFRGEPVYAGQR